MFIKDIEYNMSFESLIYVPVSAFVLVFLILLILILNFKNPHEKVNISELAGVSAIFSILTFFVTLGVLMFNTKEIITYTNDISEAQFINEEKFFNKISQITHVEKLQYEDDRLDEIRRVSTEIFDENNGYLELNGIKNKKKVNVLVYFEKDSTMKVSVSEIYKNADEFEYNPKVDKK